MLAAEVNLTVPFVEPHVAADFRTLLIKQLSNLSYISGL